MILILVLIGLVLRQERPEALADEAATTADGVTAAPAAGAERCTSGACAHSGAQRPAKNLTAQRAARGVRRSSTSAAIARADERISAPERAGSLPAPSACQRVELGRPLQHGAPDT